MQGVRLAAELVGLARRVVAGERTAALRALKHGKVNSYSSDELAQVVRLVFKEKRMVTMFFPELSKLVALKLGIPWTGLSEEEIYALDYLQDMFKELQHEGVLEIEWRKPPMQARLIG